MTIKAATSDPAATYASAYHSYRAPPVPAQRSNQAVDSFKTLLTLCLDTNNMHLCALVFRKVFAFGEVCRRFYDSE